MKKIWRENKPAVILLFVSFAAAVGSNFAFFATGGNNLFLFFLSIVTTVLFILFLRKFYFILQKYISISEKIKKTKIWRAFAKLFGKIYSLIENVMTLFMTLGERARRILARIIPHRRGPLLRRYNDERSFVLGERGHYGNRLRKMKWRGLHTNSERIRYIYIKFLKRLIKSGFSVSPVDTPNELYEKLLKLNNDMDNKLFSLYNLARYNHDETGITKDDIENLK
jgi:hypothetical protein